MDREGKGAPGRGAVPRGAPPPVEASGEATFHGFRLSLFQLQAVQAIRGGHNVLVSAPTGAGKTLVAEYAIEDSVRRRRRCIYTAPIKALSNQKYRDFRDGAGLDVGIMTGDVTLHPNAQVLVMTTEILRNTILENPDQLNDVEYVVFDEVHYMDDEQRGSVWEESLIFAPAEIRFICLSATVANLEQLGAWIREIRKHDLVVVHSDKRPVPLKHRLFSPAAGLFDLNRLEWVRGKVLAEGAPERGRRGRPGRRGHRGRPGFERAEVDVSGVLDQLQRQGLLPVLVFAFSRKDCERLAGKNQRRNLLSPEERERMRGLQEELVSVFQLDRGELDGEIFTLAARGIGYHHAGMLPIHKEVVERLFTSGLLRMLFTTETFALGINMPARTVVFHALKKFDGTTFDYIRTREYLQMAGRAGRQGIDAEGLVISVVGERDLEEAPLERLLTGKPEPVESRFRMGYSSILHLVERLGRHRLTEAWERSFNFYQHRARNKRAQELNRAEQGRQIEAHLSVLEELRYVDAEDRLTARGRVARNIYGFEIQITEMLFRGLLEEEDPEALATVFVGLVHEERRRIPSRPPPQRLHGALRRKVDLMVADLVRREKAHGVPEPMKAPCWSLSPAVAAWLKGGDFDDLEGLVDASSGDLCRTFRMALQLMRHVRRAIDPSWDLHERLGAVLDGMNRDEVDARRQLELG